MFEDSDNTKLFTEFMSLSVKDLLDRYFESDLLKGFLAFVGIVSIYGGPRTPGTAYEYTHHSINDFDGRFGQWGFARGGMGNITEAMANGARHYGVTIKTNATVERVIVESGAARGVFLESGEEMRANIVASNADPKRTYLTLVDPKHLLFGHSYGLPKVVIQRVSVRNYRVHEVVAARKLDDHQYGIVRVLFSVSSHRVTLAQES